MSTKGADTPKAATSQTPQTRAEFFAGYRDGLPIAITASFFGMMFGAAAIKQGMTFGEAVLSSATIYAGASQFVMLELYGYHAPVWSILLAVLAVNFRHVLYSASLGRKMKAFSQSWKFIAFFFMVDPQFGSAEHRIEQTGGLTRAFYFGYAACLYPLWIIATVIGAFFGAIIGEPATYGLDMLLPIYFLTLVMGFKNRPNWLPVALTSGVASAIIFTLYGPPWHISLGALFGIALAAILGKPDRGGAVDNVKPADSGEQAP